MTRGIGGIRLVANLLLLLAVTFFMVALLGKRVAGEAYIGDFGTTDLNTGWVLDGEKDGERITLPTVLQAKKGERILMSNTLPDDIGDGMRLCMRTALQDIYFYIDGELRGSYATEHFEGAGEYLPSSYVMIDLSDADAGKPIRIELVIKSQAKLNEVSVGYGNNAWFAVMENSLPVVVAACILVGAGVLAVLSYFLMKRLLGTGRAVLFLGQVMIITGMWIVSESNMRQIIFRAPWYSNYFAYMLIEMVSGFVAMYFNEIQSHRYQKAYTVIQALVFGQLAVNTVLALCRVAEFHETLLFSHIWMLVGVITVIVTAIADVITKRIRKYSVTAIGMVLFILFCMVEIVGFYVRDFYVLGKYLCVGLIVLLAATMIQTIRDEIRNIRQTAELKSAKEEAENASRAKSALLANISHEIRTPINAVLGMSEMILRESTQNQVRKYAADAKDSAVILLEIVNEILDSSKLEAGMMELVTDRYQMSELLRKLYNMVHFRAEEKGLSLKFEVDSTMPEEYIGDEKRIRQVLINLLTNAIKYTNRGTVTLTVGCNRKQKDAVLFFAVKDTGIGIKEEDKGKVCEAFRRVDETRNRDVEGTGLGLNLTSRFLTLMGSSLQLESEYGKGSVFSFELTQEIAGDEVLGDFQIQEGQLATASVTLEKYIAPEASVLVVDDSEMNRKVFRNLLKRTRAKVFEAESGRECLALLQREHFHLIFMDHRMPDLDGIETFRRMKEEKLGEGVPVIMLTANAFADDKAAYIQEGFRDFLSKPVVPEELDELVRKYLPTKLVRKPDGNSDKLHALADSLPELDLEKGLITAGGDEDFYQELFSDFVGLPIREELTAYFQQKDAKNYNIRIHGFKNNAYSVGLMGLGDLAYEMEKLSVEALNGDIEALQKRLFEQYGRVCKQYEEAVR